jgi:hypothetical protein
MLDQNATLRALARQMHFVADKLGVAAEALSADHNSSKNCPLNPIRAESRSKRRRRDSPPFCISDDVRHDCDRARKLVDPYPAFSSPLMELAIK